MSFFMNDVMYSFILCLSFHNKNHSHLPGSPSDHMIVKIHLLAVPTYLISVVLGLQSLSLSKNCGALNTVILPKYYYTSKPAAPNSYM